MGLADSVISDCIKRAEEFSQLSNKQKLEFINSEIENNQSVGRSIKGLNKIKGMILKEIQD